MNRNSGLRRVLIILLIPALFVGLLFLISQIDRTQSGNSYSNESPDPGNTGETAAITPQPLPETQNTSKPTACKLKLKAGSASVSPSAIKVSYGKKIKSLPTPEKSGYQFVGWFTDRVNGERIKAGKRSYFTKNTDLYARWKKQSVGPDYGVKGLPVLMYHQFYDPEQGETPKAGLAANYMPVNDFDEQMHWLSESGYYYPSWDEVHAYVKGEIDLPKKSIVITIDDGSKSFYTYAIPILEKYQVKATGFIITKYLKSDSADKIKSQYISLQSHSHNMHGKTAGGLGYMTSQTYKIALKDVKRSAKVLGTKDAFAYPFGRYDEQSEKVVEDAGFKVAFTTRYGSVYPGMDPYALPRVRINSGQTISQWVNGIKIG